MNKPKYSVAAMLASSVFIFGVGIKATCAQTNAPSFDCSLASHPMERLICASSSLSNADAEMARRFRSLRELSQPQDQDILVNQQRQWLADVRSTCAVPVSGPGVGPSGAEQCVERAYSDRTMFLNNALRQNLAVQSPDSSAAKLTSRASEPIEPNPTPTSKPTLPIDNIAADIEYKRVAFVQACDALSKTTRTLTKAMFGGIDRQNRMVNFQEVVEKRKQLLHVGYDPVDREIADFTKMIDHLDVEYNQTTTRNENGIRLRSAALADKARFISYVGFLKVASGPSLQAARQELQQASTDRVERQVEDQAKARELAGEALADNARRQKERDVVAARIEEDELAIQRASTAALQLAAQKLPGCSAIEAINAIRDKFEIRREHIRKLDIPTPNEDQPFGGTELDPERLCQVHIISTSLDTTLKFAVRWRDEGHNALLVTLIQ